MLYVKFALAVFALIGVVLSFVYGLHHVGGHGFLVIGLCALPAVIVSYTVATRRGMPRWGSIVSALGLILVGMKTSGGGDDLENIMMVGAAGALVAIVLAIRPDRPSPPQGHRVS